MIRFENVSLSYGGAAAVRDLNFTVGRGEFVALVGANGAGKTTVSKLMNGLLKPTAGRVLVDGVPTTSLRTSALAKKIGFLFQNPDRQLCKPTIREEIRFGLAQTARGVAFDTKNPFKKLGLILPLCMPLLISSVGRIHDTAAAAEMRGFTLRTRESQSRRYTFKSGDLFAALIAAALVAAGALL